MGVKKHNFRVESIEFAAKGITGMVEVTIYGEGDGPESNENLRDRIIASFNEIIDSWEGKITFKYVSNHG